MNSIDTVLKHGRNQPFYNLLLDDQTNRYCSQENLRLDESPTDIGHPEVACLFPEGLKGRRRLASDSSDGKKTEWVLAYEASPELANRYPYEGWAPDA